MSSIQQRIAFLQVECMAFSISWVLWPIPLTTLVVLGYRCKRDKRFLEALPLLTTQLNSALIYGCLAAKQVGFFNIRINGT